MNPPVVDRTRSRLTPGTVLDDRFEIAEFLGAGSFGEVYRAKQLIFGQYFRDVALKLFAEGVVTAANAREILNDAIIILGLVEEDHTLEIGAHLVQVYDMGIVRVPAQRAFMSMKLIPGRKTLKSEVYRYRHTGGMPVMLSLRYLREMLLPLAWMHCLETPVVHGDLKPDNVMMTEDAHLILVDFGLAAHMPLGVRGGDIAYLAPEKLLGLNGGQESDIYSVGLIWYELLTGVHPFQGVGMDALGRADKDGYLQAHLDARKRPIVPLDPNRPAEAQKNRTVPAAELNTEFADYPQLELLLNTCLADNIAERHANARILLDKLDAYIASGILDKSSREAIGLKPSDAGKLVPASSPPCGLPEGRSDEMKLADAVALVRQDKPQQAMAMVGNILRASPKLVAAHVLQVRILLGMPGRLAEAAQACEVALKLAPENPEVYEMLAELRMAQNKPSQAAGFRSKAAELRRVAPRVAGRTY